MSEGKRFIGRKQELDFLESKYAEDRAQLIVLYGRRRVGKTETLREFCREKPHVFFSFVYMGLLGYLNSFTYTGAST